MSPPVLGRQAHVKVHADQRTLFPGALRVALEVALAEEIGPWAPPTLR